MISRILADTITCQLNEFSGRQRNLESRNSFQDNSFKISVNKKKIEFFQQFLKDKIIVPCPTARAPIDEDMKADIEALEMERSILIQLTVECQAEEEQKILNEDIESIDADIDQIKKKLKLYLEHSILPGVLVETC